MFLLILIVVVVMDGILLWLWLARVHGELRRFREELNLSWIQLREAIISRREMMPYLIACISVSEREAVEAIGNACDLASPSADIHEQARAESRLDMALRHLMTRMENHPECKTDTSLQRLYAQMQTMERRIALLAEMYNKQASAYNMKLDGASAKVLGLFVALKPAESYPADA